MNSKPLETQLAPRAPREPYEQREQRVTRRVMKPWMLEIWVGRSESRPKAGLIPRAWKS